MYKIVMITGASGGLGKIADRLMAALVLFVRCFAADWTEVP